MLPLLFILFTVFGSIATSDDFYDVSYGDEVDTDVCRLPNGNFPNPDDCASFIACKSGESSVELCPDQLLYNPDTLTCDFSDTEECSSSDDFSSTSTLVPTNDIVCEPEGPNIHPSPNSCSEYYLCNGDNAYKVECPSGLLLNKEKLTCDYSENVECDSISSATTRIVVISETSQESKTSAEIVETTTPAKIATTSELTNKISSTPAETTPENILTTTKSTTTENAKLQSNSEKEETTTVISETSSQESETSAEIVNITTPAEIATTTVLPIISSTDVATTSEDNILTTTNLSTAESTKLQSSSEEEETTTVISETSSQESKTSAEVVKATTPAEIATTTVLPIISSTDVVTTSEDKILTTTNSSTAESTKLQSSSETTTVTVFTVRKQPTVVIELTEPTKEGENELSETTSTTITNQDMVKHDSTTFSEVTTIDEQATSSDTTNPYTDLTNTDDFNQTSSVVFESTTETYQLSSIFKTSTLQSTSPQPTTNSPQSLHTDPEALTEVSKPAVSEFPNSTEMTETSSVTYTEMSVDVSTTDQSIASKVPSSDVEDKTTNSEFPGKTETPNNLLTEVSDDVSNTTVIDSGSVTSQENSTASDSKKSSDVPADVLTPGFPSQHTNTEEISEEISSSDDTNLVTEITTGSTRVSTDGTNSELVENGSTYPPALTNADGLLSSSRETVSSNATLLENVTTVEGYSTTNTMSNEEVSNTENEFTSTSKSQFTTEVTDVTKELTEISVENESIEFDISNASNVDSTTVIYTTTPKDATDEIQSSPTSKPITESTSSDSKSSLLPVNTDLTETEESSILSSITLTDSTANTDDPSKLPDDRNDTQSTLTELSTTVTDEITPEKTMSTSQTLMSSDPSTDNETVEFSTTIKYSVSTAETTETESESSSQDVTTLTSTSKTEVVSDDLVAESTITESITMVSNNTSPEAISDMTTPPLTTTEQSVPSTSPSVDQFTSENVKNSTDVKFASTKEKPIIVTEQTIPVIETDKTGEESVATPSTETEYQTSDGTVNTEDFALNATDKLFSENTPDVTTSGVSPKGDESTTVKITSFVTEDLVDSDETTSNEASYNSSTQLTSEATDFQDNSEYTTIVTENTFGTKLPEDISTPTFDSTVLTTIGAVTIESKSESTTADLKITDPVTSTFERFTESNAYFTDTTELTSNKNDFDNIETTTNEFKEATKMESSSVTSENSAFTSPTFVSFNNATEQTDPNYSTISDTTISLDEISTKHINISETTESTISSKMTDSALITITDTAMLTTAEQTEAIPNYNTGADSTASLEVVVSTEQFNISETTSESTISSETPMDVEKNDSALVTTTEQTETDPNYKTSIDVTSSTDVGISTGQFNISESTSESTIPSNISMETTDSVLVTTTESKIHTSMNTDILDKISSTVSVLATTDSSTVFDHTDLNTSKTNITEEPTSDMETTSSIEHEDTTSKKSTVVPTDETPFSSNFTDSNVFESTIDPLFTTSTLSSLDQTTETTEFLQSSTKSTISDVSKTDANTDFEETTTKMAKVPSTISSTFDISATTMNTGLFSTLSTSDTTSSNDTNFESTESSKATGHRYISDSIPSQATELDSTSATSIESTTLEMSTLKSTEETSTSDSISTISSITDGINSESEKTLIVLSSTDTISFESTSHESKTVTYEATSTSGPDSRRSTGTEISTEEGISADPISETSSSAISDIEAITAISTSPTYSSEYSITEQRPTIPSTTQEKTSTTSDSFILETTSTTTWKPSNDSTEIFTSTVSVKTDSSSFINSTTVAPSGIPTDAVSQLTSKLGETSESETIVTNSATTAYSFTETETVSPTASDLETTPVISITSTGYSTTEQRPTVPSTTQEKTSTASDLLILETTSTTTWKPSNDSTEMFTSTVSDKTDSSGFIISTTVAPSDVPTDTVTQLTSKLDETSEFETIFTNPATFSKPYSFTETETVSPTSSDLETTPVISITSTGYSATEQRPTVPSTTQEKTSTTSEMLILETTSTTTWKPSNDSTEIFTSTVSDKTDSSDFIISTTVTPSDVLTDTVSQSTSKLDETSEFETIFTNTATTGEFSKSYSFIATETVSPTASDLETTPIISVTSTGYSTTDQRPTVPSTTKENTSITSYSSILNTSTTLEPIKDFTEILTSTVNDSTDIRISTTVASSDEPTEIGTKSATKLDEMSGSQMPFTSPATFSKPHSFTETETASTTTPDSETTPETSHSSTYSTLKYSTTGILTSTSTIDESTTSDSSVLDTMSTTWKPTSNNSTEIVTETENNRTDRNDFESSTIVVSSDIPSETVSNLDETTISRVIFTNPSTTDLSEPYSFTETETVRPTTDLKTTPEPSILSTYSTLEYSVTEISTIASTMDENKSTRADFSVFDTTSTTSKPSSQDSTEIVPSTESGRTDGNDFVSSTTPSDIPTEIITNFTSKLHETSAAQDIFTTPVSPETPMTLSPMCTASEGFYPNPSNCSTFYECSKGILLLSSCAENNHFNPIKRICEHPCQAKCDENANCPSTEDGISSGGTSQVFTTGNIPSSTLLLTTTDTERDSITTEIQTISTILPENLVSESTSGTSIFTESNTSPSPYESTYISISDSTLTDVSTKYISYPNTEVTTRHSISTDASTLRDGSTTPTMDLSTKSDVSPPFYFSSQNSISESDATEYTSITQVTTSHSSVLTDATKPVEASTTPTVDLSTKSDVSPSHYFSSPDSTTKNDASSTEYTPDPMTQVTTRHSSVLTDSTTSDSSTVSIIDLSTTEVSLSSVTDDYLGSISTESPITLIDKTTEPFISLSSTTEPERILTETTSTGMSEITTARYVSSTVEQTTLVPDDIASDSSDDYDSSSPVSTSETTHQSSSITTVTQTTKCESGNCISSKVPTLSTPAPYSVCHRNDFLPRANCNEYMDCTYKVPVKMRCPLGLHFNPTTRVCDWPYSAGCGELPNPLFNPDQYFKCPCKSCLVPSTEKCSEYYVCLGFTAYKLKCSNNLLFDPKLDTCNYAAVVECPESSTTRSTESTTISTTKSTTPARRRTTAATTSRPGRFTCPSREGLFKDPDNCGKFYQCSNRHPYQMLCAGNTHFSEITERCEYPCDAKCDLSLACGESSSVAPNDPRCTCRTCKLPSPDSCTKYIVCLNGRARIQNCPWGQTFDVKRNACDWADRVKCRHSETCPELNGEFPHKEDCHKFVHCSNGIPYVKKCPSVLEFDPVRRRCEWPSGRCQHSPIPKEFDIFRPEEHKEGWRCPKKFGYFSDEDHCNKFYHCSLGTPLLKECSDGLLYNHRHQTCDWKKHVRCNSNRNQIPKKCRVYSRHATCPMDRTPQPHAQCNMYYDCTAGRACAKQCPIGLYFNRTSGMCDLPANVKCFNDREEYSLRELSVSCLSSDHKRMPNPSDFACYYRCRQGKVISGCCSKGHVYNQNLDKCQRKTRSFRI